MFEVKVRAKKAEMKRFDLCKCIWIRDEMRRPLLVELVRASPTFNMENQVLATYLWHFRRITAVSRFVLLFKMFVFVSI